MVKSRRKTGRTIKKSRRRKSTKKTTCGLGYVRNRKTGRCVYATGSNGRQLNKTRAAKPKSHKRDGRQSPNVSATLYSVGYVSTGHDGNLWKIKKTTTGIKRWVRA